MLAAEGYELELREERARILLAEIVLRPALPEPPS
jgi:hypothetical protein